MNDWKSLRTRKACRNTFSRYTTHCEKFADKRFPCFFLFPSPHICSASISLTPWPLHTSYWKSHLLCRHFTASSCIIPSLQLGLQAPSPFHGRVLIWFSLHFILLSSLCALSAFFSLSFLAYSGWADAILGLSPSLSPSRHMFKFSMGTVSRDMEVCTRVIPCSTWGCLHVALQRTSQTVSCGRASKVSWDGSPSESSKKQVELGSWGLNKM